MNKRMGKYPEGWMSRHELAWLAAHGAGARKIAEVGVWMGRSTVALLSRCPESALYAVDTWAGVQGDALQSPLYADPQAAYKAFLRNLAGPIDRGQVRVMRMTSMEAAAQLRAEHGQDFDLVFLDADHSYEAVHADILAYRGLVKPGGILSGHDYAEKWEGVRRAVDELLPGRTLGPVSLWSVVL